MDQNIPRNPKPNKKNEKLHNPFKRRKDKEKGSQGTYGSLRRRR